MKLKAILDTLDGLHEALKQFYTEIDGKFVLSVEGVREHPEAKGLHAALERERQTKRDLQSQLDGLNDRFGGLPDDFTTETYHQLKDGGTGNVDQRLADQKTRLEADFARKEAKLTGDRDKFKNRVEKLATENAISTALVEANVAPHMQEPVRAMFEKKIKVEYEGDDAIVTIDSLPPVDAIKAWATTDTGKHFIAAPSNSGGGGGNNQPGNGGNTGRDNPWSKDGWNLTRQALLEKDEPPKAAQLKAAAGK